jgi:hypothetical protein
MEMMCTDVSLFSGGNKTAGTSARTTRAEQLLSQNPKGLPVREEEAARYVGVAKLRLRPSRA